MTSCLLIKAPDRLVAVSDGRLSVSNEIVSFETTDKIRRVTPKYRIPHVSMGRFSHYTEFSARDWFLAYAGTYALVSMIADRFIENISRSLFVTRGENGAPRLDYAFDEYGRFDDDFNFQDDELLQITPRVVVDELKAAMQMRCEEWSTQRGWPDCEFLLFGEHEESRRYVAFRVAIEASGWYRGASVRIKAEEIADGVIASIGSVDVASRVYGDHALQDGIKGWEVNQSDIEVHNMFADSEFQSMVGTSRPTSPISQLPENLNWNLKRVRQRFVDIIRATSDQSVGGELTVASGGGYDGISLEKVRAQ